MGIRVRELGRRAAPRTARAFAAELRGSDLREILGTSGASASGAATHLAECAADTLAAGGRVWSVTDRRRTLALFGARPDSLTADSAAIWMLAAKGADRRPLAFARWSRRCMGMVFGAFPGVSAFYNFVPACAGRPAAWLRWLGAWFSVADKFVSPWTGETFVRFVIEREEVRHV